MGQSESNFVLKSDFRHKFKDDDEVECFDDFGIILYTGSFKDLLAFNHKLGIVRIQKIKKDNTNKNITNKGKVKRNTNNVIFVDIGASFSDISQRKRYQIKN